MATTRRPTVAYLSKQDREALRTIMEEEDRTASKAIVCAVRDKARQLGWKPKRKDKVKE